MIELKDVLINYHDSIRHIKTVELNANNLLLIRKNDPKNNGVGYLYLYEVYEMLGIPFNVDRNIGITTKPGDTWHNLYSPWISVRDKLLPKNENCLVCWNNGEISIENSYEVSSCYYITHWMPLPEPPEELKS